MIKRINITNFGSFGPLLWKNQIKDKAGNIVDLKRLNILYGRNYSGKTTLSRIVRSLETGVLPPRYPTPPSGFELDTDSGLVTHLQLASHGHEVRVFNKDFVDDHLSFLRDDHGHINPFAIVGEKNVAVEKEIHRKQEELGSLESKAGLIFEHAQKLEKWKTKAASATTAESERASLLAEKARVIKNNRTLDQTTYNITKIEADIQRVRTSALKPLSEKEEEQLKALLKQDPLPEIASGPTFTPKLTGLITQANTVAAKVVQPSKPIQDLLNDALLQSWAKSGMPLHRGKRSTCGFCGNPIPEDLWSKLDNHFSEASGALDDDISRLIEALETEERSVTDISVPSKEAIYSPLHSELNQLALTLSGHASKYKKSIAAMLEHLQARKNDPFKALKPIQCSDSGPEIAATLQGLILLVKKQELQTGTLAADQKKARDKLRLNAIVAFISEIKLTQLEEKIKQLKSDSALLQTDADTAAQRISVLEREIEDLRKQLKDERKGAEKVNKYLTHFFGHDSLSLVAVDTEDGAGVKFEVRRGTTQAYNLSDGECSLLAFCYFMGRLSDASSDGKRLIIYIDDPISSLDSNHIFFVFSLIQTLIASPQIDTHGVKYNKYKQLFISTHNLDFLKYLKTLKHPEKGGTEHFLLERGKSGSVLEQMPAYLQQYVTEFHYLFDQICRCTLPASAAVDHHCFFNFGNNMRKFFEVYLFFKLPWSVNSGDHNRRLVAYFEEDFALEPLAQRITNELSHGADMFDRSTRPIEYEEITKLARYVLAKVKTSDPEQYAALVEAVGHIEA